jgi:hypothetical protein
MNAQTMIQNREYVETLIAIETKVNNELVEYANKFYLEKLSKIQEKELLAMSLEDKMWLLEQYKEENSSYSPPVLETIY